MSGKITLLIGLPRSGKSTWANEVWIREHDWYGYPRLILSGDDIRKAICGERFNSYTEDFVAATLHVALRALFNRGHHILVDDTHSSWKNILPKLYIDPNLEVEWMIPNKEVHSKEFKEYVGLCKLRAINTNQADLIPVIERMASNLAKLLPTFDEDLVKYRKMATETQPIIQTV